MAINPSGATKNFFDNTKDPISADAGSRRTYVSDTVSGAAIFEPSLPLMQSSLHLTAASIPG